MTDTEISTIAIDLAEITGESKKKIYKTLKRINDVYKTEEKKYQVIKSMYPKKSQKNRQESNE